MLVKTNNLKRAQSILQNCEDLQKLVKRDKEKDKKHFDIVLNQQEKPDVQ